MKRSPAGLPWFAWLAIGFIGGLLAISGYHRAAEPTELARRQNWVQQQARWSQRFHALGDVLDRECNDAAHLAMAEMLREWSDAIERGGPLSPPP